MKVRTPRKTITDVYLARAFRERFSFICPISDPVAHRGAVRGVSVDGLNQLTVSAGADKLVHIWKFKSRKLVHSIDLGTTPVTTHLHRDRYGTDDTTGNNSIYTTALLPTDFSFHVVIT